MKIFSFQALHDATKEELKQTQIECDELRNQIIEVRKDAQEELDKKDQEIKLIVKKSYEELENIKVCFFCIKIIESLL